MLPNISKIFGRIIQQKIVFFALNHGLSSDLQFGFKAKHSTIHAINKLVSDIHKSFNNREGTGACLIDLEKAFDSVWIDGLLYKLEKSGLPFYLLKCIYNMLIDKKFIVSLNNITSSKTFTIEDGLQQDTVNSPVLFSLFINDLLQEFETNINYVNILAFADDLIIYKNSNKVSCINAALQLAFNKVNSFCKLWHLKINMNKCETILFRPICACTCRDINVNHGNFKIVNPANGNQLLVKNSVS